MIQPEMKLVAGVISLRSFWQKWNFISGDKISCKHYPKWNHMKGNICTCVNKNDWLLLSKRFISDHPQNEIRFIPPTMKSNGNRISFMVDWNFVSGRFHFGSHVTSLESLTNVCFTQNDGQFYFINDLILLQKMYLAHCKIYKMELFCWNS